MYEIEKRSALNKTQFEKLKKYLDKHAESLGTQEMKSYLFREPTFLRIRIVDQKITITEKIGSYDQAVRREEEYELDSAKLPAFVEEKKHNGYTHCSLVHTIRTTYKIDELKVELNQIDHLGLIVEIEAMTAHAEEIDTLTKEIDACMKKLDLKELDTQEYQEMMTKMYAQTLKPVEHQSFL